MWTRLIDLGDKRPVTATGTKEIPVKMITFLGGSESPWWTVRRVKCPATISVRSKNSSVSRSSARFTLRIFFPRREPVLGLQLCAPNKSSLQLYSKVYLTLVHFNSSCFAPMAWKVLLILKISSPEIKVTNNLFSWVVRYDGWWLSFECCYVMKFSS